MKWSPYSIAAVLALSLWLIAGWRLVYQTIAGSKALSGGGSSSFFSLKDLFLHFFFLAIAVLGYLGSFAIARFIVHDMHISLPSPVLSEMVQDHVLFVQAVGIFLVFFFFLFLYSLVPEGVRKRIAGGANGWKEWMKGLGLGVLLWPAVTSVIWVVQFIISGYRGPVPQNMIEALVQIVNRPILFGIMAFQIAFLVPFLEETLFRGYLLSFLRGTIHPFFAYLLNALLFAWMHYSSAQQASNYAFIPALFLFGLVAALIRDEKNSLARSIGLHTGFNTTSILLLVSGLFK